MRGLMRETQLAQLHFAANERDRKHSNPEMHR